MRLLLAVFCLVTPLRAVAAATVCIVAEHGGRAACESGAGQMGGHEGQDPNDADPVHLDDAGEAGTAAAPVGCGSLGLCTATAPSIAGSITALSIEPCTLSQIPIASPLLELGIRPAPPIHPPRA